jgi:hypothetical protein
MLDHVRFEQQASERIQRRCESEQKREESAGERCELTGGVPARLFDAKAQPTSKIERGYG